LEKNSKQKDDNEEIKIEKDRSFVNKYKVFIGSLILIIGFVISGYIAFHIGSLPGISIIGIGILLTMLVAGNILSEEHELTSGEVRRAIAVSFVSVFFWLLAFGNTIQMENNLLKPVIENFWWIIITIIGFYFGGRTAEKIVENISRK